MSFLIKFYRENLMLIESLATSSPDRILLERLIQRKILNELSNKILSGELVANDSISIDFENNELSFKN